MVISEQRRFTRILHSEGFKATPGRLSLLQILAKADRPLAIHEIAHELKDRLNEVTVYRALESLCDVGIIRRIDMQHAHAHYELSEGEKHHHHIICKKCGRVEDVLRCDAKDVEKTVLKKSKHFSAIRSHSLEFFGMCKRCSK